MKESKIAGPELRSAEQWLRIRFGIENATSVYDDHGVFLSNAIL